MPAFPNYGAAQIAALEEQANALLAVFAARGYERAEPSVLQSADIFLDRSGEEIRHRTFAFTDPSGNDLCLRPDITIPISRMQLSSNANYPARLCYNGLVFRHQPAEPERPTQFWQAGAELLGLEDRAAAETEILSLAVEALHAAGLNAFTVKLGDLALFSSFIDALAVPPQWRNRLKRHFWRADYFDKLLQQLSGNATSDAQRLLAHLGTLAPAEAHSAFEGLMDLLGIAPQGGRMREEIVERLMERAADAAALSLDPKLASSIARLLAVSGPAEESLNQIRALTKEAGVALDAPLAAMEQRLRMLNELGVESDRVSFAARFGRNMEYYTGFVFELWSCDAEGTVQIAGGGRYDSLLEQLGAGRAIPAIGVAIRTERLLAACKAQGATK
jgi:ATP phosphoribosyltransferase regulatory subunit